MRNTARVWISEQARDRLTEELATLRALNATGADDSDGAENAAAVRRARQARIRQIRELLLNAVVGDPPDDGVAEPGMVVTVRYHDTRDTETFLLGVRGAEYTDVDVYSVQSPLGAAINGARPGQRRTYQSPSGAPITVTVLKAAPHGLRTTDVD